ncbi:serine hydrolase domain-containing protein [Microscilla marina]|uniref:Beta-lactamase n=1 Tax=Microscilla marina ATCC 23134 TaxID=313606 RepID=A1ZS47_MICM2|nr:serine hydrolase domain-containing protein [Microscilla marina]EAY26770.1 beta-lactamase [Microscilla marina ATCC 23134]
MKKITLFNLCIFLMALFALSTLQAQNHARTIDQYLTKANQEGFSGVALVAHKGKIIFSQGYGFANREKRLAFDPNSVFDIGSITKQFTGAAIMKLEMEGKLKTSDVLTKYLPNLPAHMHKITLHHLLTHSAGLPGGIGPDEEVLGKEAYLKRLFTKKLSDSFGSFAYSNVGYSLLAMVIEQASGMEYEQFLHKKIFAPAGMTQTGYRLPTWSTKNIVVGYRNGNRWGSTHLKSHYNQGVTYHLKGNGGIMSTVLDLHKWYKAIKNNTVLSKEATQKYIAKHIKDGGGHYGYGWGTEPKPGREIVWHNGGNGFFNAFMGYYLAKDLVIIVATNYGKSADPYAHPIDRIMHGEFKTMNEKLAKRYQGAYRLPSGEKFKVRFNANSQLEVPIHQAALYQLFSGSIADKASVAATYNQKISVLGNTLLKHNYAQYAKIEHQYMLEGSEAAIASQIKRSLERREKRLGKIKAVEVLGSVARQKGKYYLSAARFAFAKGNNYVFYTWKGNRLIGVRVLNEAGMTKKFDYQGKHAFFAESNQLKIQLTTQQGKPAIRVGDKVLVKE